MPTVASAEVCPVAARPVTENTALPSGSTAGLAASQSSTPRATAAAPRNQAAKRNKSGAGSGPADRSPPPTPPGKGRLCTCMSWHCRNEEGQHEKGQHRSAPRKTSDSEMRKRHQRPPCTRFAAEGSCYCSCCQCGHEGCTNLRYSCDRCRQHWHESAEFAPEWSIIIEFGDLLGQLDPPDQQTFESTY